MLTEFLFLTLFTAGAATLWRNLLFDNKSLRAIIHGLPRIPRKSLSCGFCSTYWLAFVVVILTDFIPVSMFTTSINLPNWFEWSAVQLVEWMSVGMCAVVIRFTYVLIQEHVHLLVHARNGHRH